MKIIMGIKDRYEKFHAVSYTDDAQLSLRYHCAHSGESPLHP